MRVLTAIPVYNEEKHLSSVLREVRRYSSEILVVNDGSTDGTTTLLQNERDLHVVTHPRNRGYGAALISAFDYALHQAIYVLVTMDCDGQHEPSRIPVLLEAIHDADIVSGSRYLRDFRQDTAAPNDRREINRIVSTPDVVEKLTALGADPAGGAPSFTAVVIHNRGFVAMLNLAFDHLWSTARVFKS